MRNVVYIAPFYGNTVLTCLRALLALDDVRVGIVSHQPLEALPAHFRERVAGHYKVTDCLDAEQLVTATQAFQGHFGRVHRVMGFLEQMQVPLGIVRDRLNIPGMTEEVALNFRDKNQMKKVLREAGLPVARDCRVTSAEDLTRFVEQVGYPIVFKPLDGAGTVATQRITNDAELVDVLNRFLPTPERAWQAEEFVQGREYTFEAITLKGRVVWHSSTRYLPGPLEVLENAWMQYCVVLPVEQKTANADFVDLNKKALKALGMKNGLTHMEFFRRADGTAVISEVAARPPGVNIMTMMGIAHGVDFWQAWAEVMVKRTFDVPERTSAVGCCFFRGSGPGSVVASVEGIDEAQARVGSYVVQHKLPRVGQRRSSHYEGEGFAIVQADTTDEVFAALKTLITTVKLRYDDGETAARAQ